MRDETVNLFSGATIMGLDITEMIMEIEETFNIRIEDRDAERIRTVGELHAYLLTKTSPRQRVEGCLSSHLFYRFRRAIQEQYGMPRQLITPNTPLNAFLPETDRREHWERFTQRTGLQLPSLKYAGKSEQVGCVLFLGLSGVTFGSFSLVFKGHYLGLLPALASILGMFVIGITWGRLRTAIPEECRTLRGLTMRAIAMNTYQFAFGQQSSLTDNESWEVLRGIIAEHLDVNPDRITPELSFVEDLGI